MDYKFYGGMYEPKTISERQRKAKGNSLDSLVKEEI